MTITDIISGIKPLYSVAMEKAGTRQDNLFKPLGSLGTLEEISIQLAGITGNVINRCDKRAMVIMCSDNGVWHEGVSPNPQSVTKSQTINFVEGYSAISVLAKRSGSDLYVVDMGVASDLNDNRIIHKKIRYGTNNIAKGPAMTRDEAITAIMTGFSLAKELHQKGYDIIGNGEMGVGNTTTASAIIVALLDCSIDSAVGKGAGITPEMFEHKKDVISRALHINNPDKNDPIDVLYKLGGFDIAALCGLYLGAAYYRIPIVIDGLISITAALVAYKLQPLTCKFMIPSHISKERGYNICADEMGIKAFFDFGMRLGEGSGCPLTFFAVDCACHILSDMKTFEESNVDKADYVDIRKDNDR